MTVSRNDWQLFGIDLGRLYHIWRQGWGEAVHWRPFAWLSPEARIRVIDTQGRIRIQETGHDLPGDGDAPYTAVVLPEDICLSRELLLPLMSNTELEEALELEAQSVSPFPPDQLVWGWRTVEVLGNTMRILLVVAARRHVEAHMASLGEPLSGHEPTEAWSAPRDPVVLRGFGETARQLDTRRARRINLGMLGLILFLVLALAATPVWHAKQRQSSAEASLARLQQQAAEQLAQREAVLAAHDRIRQFQALTAGTIEPLVLLEEFSRILGDDVTLERLDIREQNVRLTGTADNAAALMEQLGGHPGFSNVRAPTAISRQRGTDKEVFVIELTLGEGEVQ